MFEDADLTPRDRALYEKLYASHGDLTVASSCARFILKKKWHTIWFLRRGGVPIQQIAFTTTMIVAYCRPFAPGRGGNGNVHLPQRLIRYNAKEVALHARLLKLRHQEYAHTDATTVRVRPLKGESIKAIASLRGVCFSAEELNLFIAMTERLAAKIQERIEEIRLSGS